MLQQAITTRTGVDSHSGVAPEGSLLRDHYSTALGQREWTRRRYNSGLKPFPKKAWRPWQASNRATARDSHHSPGLGQARNRRNGSLQHMQRNPRILLPVHHHKKFLKNALGEKADKAHQIPSL